MEKPGTEKPEAKPAAEGVTLSKEEHQKLLDQSKELESLREKLLRSAADYDNAKKRLARERDEFLRFAQERFCRDLLPALDNFERALEHARGADQKVLAGIQLIWKQLLDALALHGLKRFSVEGETFDPHRHEAVDRVVEEGPEGVVVKGITSGYLLHDRVLRPAKVRLRVKPGEEKEKEEELT